MQSRRTFLTAVVPALAAAQTLAHPGWRGNGITIEQWWRRVAILQLPSDMTFAKAAAALDVTAPGSFNALLLPDLQPEPQGAAPFAERFGSMDNLDALLREASARHVHLLLTGPLLRLANSSGELRFWLARGIAGFNVGTLRPADVDALHVLRSAVDGYPGQRLILTHLDAAADAHFAQRFAREFHPPTLRLLTQVEAASQPHGPEDAILVTDVDVFAPPALHGSIMVVPWETASSW